MGDGGAKIGGRRADAGREDTSLGTFTLMLRSVREPGQGVEAAKTLP